MSKTVSKTYVCFSTCSNWKTVRVVQKLYHVPRRSEGSRQHQLCMLSCVNRTLSLSCVHCTLSLSLMNRTLSLNCVIRTLSLSCVNPTLSLSWVNRTLSLSCVSHTLSFSCVIRTLSDSCVFCRLSQNGYSFGDRPKFSDKVVQLWVNGSGYPA